jgi:ATP-dependent RNA helicase DDX51/DBP6
MASIRVIEDSPEESTHHHRSRKEGKERKDKKDKKSRREEVIPTPLRENSEENSNGGNYSMEIEEMDGASEFGSMMSLSMDQSEREKLMMEVEESSVSTVEDGPSLKSTSYYINHQRLIESSVLTPLEEVCDPQNTPLSPFVIDNLKKMGMEKLFPVQAEVIPFILRGVVWGGDVCVCAPTGSGKTLAYVIPIVQTLQRRVVRRLRALILVPTHDLVVQVSSVFMRMVEGTDLVVEALYGNKGFEAEQKRLVEPHTGSFGGGSSKVDIVVTTPGRLVDHLQETEGFTMQHLQFLVIDEADRLLMHSFQEWLPKVLESIHQSREGALMRSAGDQEAGSRGEIGDRMTQKVDAVTQRSAFLNVAVMERQYTHLQKLLFSATLTQNPEKIDSLKLVNPQYFTATSGGKSFLYTIPSTLEQKLTVCTEQHKPLLLLHILTTFQNTQTLCFVGSIETAHRLTLLLKFLHAEHFLNNHPIYEYSSSLTQQERNQIILKFKSGAPGVIICSDVMARGLDIQNVRAVINYDVPFHVKTYVHRVGRTGRAGRAGTSWTIALKDEVRRFKSSLSKAENSTQTYVPLPYEEIKTYFTRYKEALRQLQIEMEREKGSAAVAKTLQHASFSLPLDSVNSGDKKSVSKSLHNQVALAWFQDDYNVLFAPTKPMPTTSEAPVAPSTELQPVTHTPQKRYESRETNYETRKVYADKTPVKTPIKAKETKKAAVADVTPAKAKRRRKHKKNELDSLSLSSSESSSSDSEDDEPRKDSSKAKEEKSPKLSSTKSKNRKKRKRNELDSLSLSSTSSSSDSDSEEEPKKDKKRKDKKSEKERHKKKSKK